jgi:hypothetical protein
MQVGFKMRANLTFSVYGAWVDPASSRSIEVVNAETEPVAGNTALRPRA